MVSRTLLAASVCAIFFSSLPSCDAELADCAAVTGGLPYKCLHDLPLTDPVQFYYKFYWQTDRVMFEFRVPSAKGWVAIVFAKPGGTPADLIGADAIVGRVTKTPVEVREIGVFRIASLHPDNTPNLADMVPLADPAWLFNPRSTDTYTSEFFSYLQLKVQRQRLGGAYPLPLDPFSTVHFLYHPTDDDYAAATGVIHHKFDVPWLRTPGGTQAQTAVPKPAPPTDAPTDAPPTDTPPTDAPPTDAPPTDAPPTKAPPTNAPPTPAPPTPAPPTPAPPTLAPPTLAPPTLAPPTLAPPTPAPPTQAPSTPVPPVPVTAAPSTLAPPPIATLAPPPTAATAAPTLAPTDAPTAAPTAVPGTAVPATAVPATPTPVTAAPTLAPSSPSPVTEAPYERPPLHFVVASSAARYSEVREGLRRFYRELYGADRETARRRVTQAEWVPATSRVVEEVSVNADTVVARTPETDDGGDDDDSGGSVARVLALNAESAGGGGGRGGSGAPKDVLLPLRVVTKEELRAEELRNETFHGVSLVAQTETHLLHTLVARGQVVATARLTSEDLRVQVSDTETRTVTLYAISLAFHYPDVGGDAQARAASATAAVPSGGGGVPPAVYSTEEGEERLVAHLHNTEGWLFRDVGCLTDRCEMVRIRVRRDTGSIGFSDGAKRLRAGLQGAGFAAVAAAAALFAGSGGAAVLGHHSPAKMVRAALVPKVLECPVNRPNDLEYALRPVPLSGRHVAPGSPDEQYAAAAVFGAAAFCAAALVLAVVFLAKQRLAARHARRAVAPASPASSGSLGSPTASATGLVSVPPPPSPRGGCGSLFARARRSLLLRLLKASFFHCLFGVAVFLYGSVSLGGLVFAVYGDSDGVRVGCAAALLAAQALPLYVYTVHAALPGMAVKVDRRSLFGPSSARYRDAAAEHEAAAAAAAAGSKPAPPREGLWERVRLFFVGREYWLETEEAGRSWVELHRPVFHHLTLAGRRFPLIELLQVAASVGVTAWRPSVHPGCIARGTLLSTLPLALMVFIVVRRPYEATYQNLAEAALCGLECAALGFGWSSMALGERRPSAHWTATVARFLANLLTACVVGKACVDALVYFLARREEAGFEALRRQSLEEMEVRSWVDAPVEAEAYARADARETRRHTVSGRACDEEGLRETRGRAE